MKKLLIPLLCVLSPIAVAQVNIGGGTVIVGGNGQVGATLGANVFTGQQTAPSIKATNLVPGQCLTTITGGVITSTGAACGGSGGGAGLGANTFTGTQTAPAFVDSSLASGQCVQTGAGGLLTVTGLPCGTGGGGGGTFSLNQYEMGQLLAPSGTVLGHTTHYTSQGILTQTALNALFSGVTPGTVELPNGHAHIIFANPNGINVQDFATDVPTFIPDVKMWGAQCDTQAFAGQVTSGSTTITVNPVFQSAFVASDAGDSNGAGPKMIEMVGLVGGVPTRFDAFIVSVTNSTTAVLSTPSPFTSVANATITFGHEDTGSAAGHTGILGAIAGSNAIEIPAGNCWAHTIFQGNNLQIHGLGPQSHVIGHAGEDLFSSYDPTNGGFVATGVIGLDNLQGLLDARIDAAKPWNDVGPTGTTTNHAGNYRPVCIYCVWSNNPLAPGWFQGPGPANGGAIVGVGSISNGSPNLTIGSAGRPANGQQIVLRSSTGTFTTTILSGGGTANIVLNANYPGTTASQVEWFAGSSAQNIQTSIPSTGRSFPMTLTLGNPIIPVPVLQYESNVAPYGLVQIDNEQCSYFGSSIWPAAASVTPSITLTACAQNGTTAASHSIGAVIIPLNPFRPTWPWPVTPTINGTGNPTPATAEFFPAWSMGNFALGSPVYNGNVYNGSESIAQSHIHDLVFGIWPPNAPNTAENPISWQMQNSTACVYLVAYPFNTHFDHIQCINTQFGKMDGGPSTNTHGIFTNGFPTGDGTTWDNITIHSAGYVFDNTYGGSNAYSNWQTFSSNGGETGTSNPGQVGGYVGGGMDWAWTSVYDDTATTTPTAYPSSSKYGVISNFYIEHEGGSQSGLQPASQFDFDDTTMLGKMQEGGVGWVIGGPRNIFTGGIFNGQPQFPVINLGANNSFTSMNTLNGTPVSNVWGVGGFLNWGQNTLCGGMTENQFGSAAGQYGVNCWGNNSNMATGQTLETFSTGNTTVPYVNTQTGYIPPAELSSSTGGWVFDATSLVSQSYVPCTVGTGTSTTFCQIQADGLSEFNIGPGQRIVAGKYAVYMGIKQASGSSQNIGIALNIHDNGCGSSGNVFQTTTMPITTTWTNQQLGGNGNIIDLTPYSGCTVRLIINGTSSSAVTEQTAYLAFAPVAEHLQAQNIYDAALTSGNCVQAGTEGVLTDTGSPCGSGGGSGFPITLGTTSIVASSTNTALAGLTLTTTTVNGVTLATGGSTSLFLNQAGGYTSPSGGGITGTVASGNIPVGTGTSSVGVSQLSDNGTTLTYAGTGGIVGSASTPASWSLSAGAGNIPALPSNSAGFAAPVTGGTSYLFKMPATWTKGYLFGAAPATGDNVNEAPLTSQATEFVLDGGVGQYGNFGVNTMLKSATMTNAGHFASLEVANISTSSCTTAPIINVYDFTAATFGAAPVTGPTSGAINGSSVSKLAQVLPFSAGDRIAIAISTAGATCASSEFSVTATVSEP